jgi:hypothetical protein
MGCRSFRNRENVMIKKIFLIFISLLLVFNISLLSLEVHADTVNDSPKLIATKSKKKASKKTKDRKYVDDKVVNDFIIKYNKNSSSNFKDIKKGNIKTKYFAISNGYYFELLNAADTNKMSITINATQETKDLGVLGMKQVFHDSTKVIDSSLNDEEINNFFDTLVSGKMSANQKLGKMLIDFIPDTDNSSGRIKINAQ